MHFIYLFVYFLFFLFFFLFYFILFFNFTIFVYFLLPWVFVGVCGLILVVMSGRYSNCGCRGFSSQWFSYCRAWTLESSGSSSCGIGLSSCEEWVLVQLLFMSELEQWKLKDYAGAELYKQGLELKGYAHICHLLAKRSICSDEFNSANHIPAALHTVLDTLGD